MPAASTPSGSVICFLRKNLLKYIDKTRSKSENIKTEMKTKNILIAKIIVSAVCLALMFSLTSNFTFAQEPTKKQSLPLSKENYGDIIAPTEGDKVTAMDKLKQLIGINDQGSGLLNTIKVIVGALAVLMIIISAVRILTAGGAEEEIKKNTKQLMYGILGLALISISGEMGRIFDLTTGGPLKNPSEMIKSVFEFNKATQIIITFFKYLIGGVAVFEIISSGLHLITLEDESKLDEEKKKLLYGIVGLAVILLSSTIVKDIFYKVDLGSYTGTSGVQPAISPGQGVKEIVGVTNFIVSFVGPLAILALIVGAIMYITAGGEEESMNKAKRVIMAAAIGIFIIYGAFAIASTVISRQFTG